MIVDRRKKDEAPSFETNMFQKRRGLDKYYWESEFYFSENTKKIFRHFLTWLKMFESKEIMIESPEIETNFEKITKILINEFKKEIK